MTQTANNYATVLLELGVTREAVDETKEILSLTQDLPKSLKSCLLYTSPSPRDA